VKCKKVVEIHDVMHLRQASFKNFEQVATFLTTEEAELNRLKQYDSVICLNQDESVYLRNQGILNTHIISPNFEIRNAQNSKRDFLGIIGSSAKPNIDGILYYQNSLINIKGLVVAGSVSNTINRGIYTNHINIMGIISDINSFYDLLYGSLVPVRFGAGVKIKTIESLVNLVPVFSTTHGVEGLPEGIAEVSCVFDKVSEWNQNNYNLLKDIKFSVIENYVNDNFSYASCAPKINDAF